jgi:uncharacterized protein YndB with AHSA1/START domain
MSQATAARNVGSLRITLPSDREIAMTRVFHAPRTLVYEAHTKPELVRRWLGVHRDWSFAVCDMDLRVGGSYRWVWRNADGRELAMGGVYLEIVAPERIVSTEKFDDPWFEGEAVSTLTLVERGGKTTLTSTTLYDSKAIRDAVLATPMEEGVSIGYDTLETVLATLPPSR